MIAVSVSLVLIALLVWSVGDNYHFASDIMAAQEMDAMTPKQGFNVIYFDEGQPVGGKFKILDHAGTIAQAHELQAKYAKQYEAEKGQVVLGFCGEAAEELSAGPRMRELWTTTEFSATALTTRSGPTSSTTKAWRAGLSTASTQPRTNTCHK